MPWRRKWLPTLVFLPGESPDREAWQTTYRSWGRKESDMIERVKLHLFELNSNLLLILPFILSLFTFALFSFIIQGFPDIIFMFHSILCFMYMLSYYSL